MLQFNFCSAIDAVHFLQCICYIAIVAMLLLQFNCCSDFVMGEGVDKVVAAVDQTGEAVTGDVLQAPDGQRVHKILSSLYLSPLG